MLDFSGKTALIAGGTSGIGLAAAEQFVQQGAAVVVAGRSPDNGEAAVGRLVELGGKAMFVRTDVRDEAQVKNLVDQTLSGYGHLDIVVNSAGVMNRIPLTELEQPDWDLVLDTNLRGVYLVCKHALPPMIQQGRGAVVNVASYLGAFGARETSPAYGASKAGVKLLTEGLNSELSDTNVKVTVVFPGATETNISENSGIAVEMDQEEGSAAMKALPASEAAEIIVEGIEKDRYSVLVGQDAKMMDLLYRVSPKRAAAYINKQMKHLLPD